MIILRNNLHKTEVHLKASIGDELSPYQVRVCRRELCGFAGCKCGGSLGERGPQEVGIQVIDHNRFKIKDQA